MKYVPKELKENVNISKSSPLRELFVLLGGLLIIFFIIYFTLGWLIDATVSMISPPLEAQLESVLGRFYWTDKKYSAAEELLKRLMNDLGSYQPEERRRNVTVHVVPSSEVNAVAIPGGHIILFSQLLKEVGSENELAMILGHEMGHFAHRDHLRGLGRGLVLVLLSSTLFGVDSAVSKLVMNTLLTIDLRHSREQELAADQYALQIINTKYGHVSGATDFFERLKGKRVWPAYLKFFSTHPFSADRIERIYDGIARNGYVLGPMATLDPILANLEGEDEKALPEGTPP